ncbi:phospholipase-like protein [Tanacetum coccineum]
MIKHSYTVVSLILHYTINIYISKIEPHGHWSYSTNATSPTSSIRNETIKLLNEQILGSEVDDVFLRMVEDLEDWNDFPWGEHMWRELYAAIRNVNSNHKQAYHKALEINPNFVPTYSLSGFVLYFKIWILESSSVTDRWWTKDSEGIPRGCFWSKHFPFQKWEYFGQFFPQDKKPNYELYPNRAEAQLEWFTRSSDYFKMYTPRAPPVEYEGFFGDYLKKLSLARTRRAKDREPFIQSCPKVVSLKDHVRALEGLCDSLMILPKEIKSLKARVYKLETIINSDQDGEPFFKYMGSTNPSANKDDVNDLVDALDDLVDENDVVEVDKNLSQDDFLKAQKLEAEKNRAAEQKRLRLQLMLKEANSRKSIDFSKSTHMKVAIERCGTNKRRYVDVLRPPIEEDTSKKVLSMDRLKKQNNDLKRPSKCIDKIYCNYYLEQFLITSGWSRCKFPWCTKIVVGRHFWDSLIRLDDERLGWLVDDHIELWVWYMWHFRQSFDDWSMVSCYFLTLLLQDSMPLFYATDEIYPLAWRDVEQVFIPINEPKRHWSLAQFHIQSGNVTFYDSQKTYDPEFRPCYSIKFTNVQNVPKQGGVFGDCGVFVCLFLYRLAHGIPLDVKDPIQTALAYREKMVKTYLCFLTSVLTL